MTAAKNILKTLGYSDSRTEEWRNLTKEEIDEKLSNLKKEAYQYE